MLLGLGMPARCLSFFSTLFCYFIEAKPGIYLPAIRQFAESCASSPFTEDTLVQIPGCCAALL